MASWLATTVLVCGSRQPLSKYIARTAYSRRHRLDLNTLRRWLANPVGGSRHDCACLRARAVSTHFANLIDDGGNGNGRHA